MDGEVEAMDGSEALLPIGQAAKRVGHSPTTLRRLVRTGALPTYARATDRRAVLVRLADVDALAVPRRLDPKEAAPMAS